MPRCLVLYDGQGRCEPLPPLCMCCGQPTTQTSGLSLGRLPHMFAMTMPLCASHAKQPVAVFLMGFDRIARSFIYVGAALCVGYLLANSRFAFLAMFATVAIAFGGVLFVYFQTARKRARIFPVKWVFGLASEEGWNGKYAVLDGVDEQFIHALHQARPPELQLAAKKVEQASIPFSS